MIDLDEIKSIDAEDILYHYGVMPSHVSKRYILAKAPYREDNNPSFQYFLTSSGVWVWNDFATGESGTHIDLVMKMENLDFKEAVKYLSETFLHGYTKNTQIEKIKADRKNKSEIKIVSLIEFELSNIHRTALEKERGYKNIDTDYVKTFKVLMEKDGKTFIRFGYGIRDINSNAIVRIEKDGYYTKEKRVWKISEGRASISYVDKGKDEIIVIEGLHDYMALYNIKGNSFNYLILNSVVNTNQAIEFLKDKEYDKIIIATDNDDAGHKAKNDLIQGLKHNNIYSLSFKSKDIDEAIRNNEKILIKKETSNKKLTINH